MKKWEYMTFKDGLKDSFLNDLGNQGWELISHTALYVPGNRLNPIQYYIFKREKL